MIFIENLNGTNAKIVVEDLLQNQRELILALHNTNATLVLLQTETRENKVKIQILTEELNENRKQSDNL